MKNRFVLALCVFFIIFMQGCPTQFVQQPGDISKTVSVVSDATDWGAPQNLTASQGLKGQINLSWTKVNGAVKYYIYSSDSMYGEFKRSGMVSASSNEYSVKTSKAGLVKYYRVSAVKSGGTESAMSEKVQGTTLVWPYLDSVSDGENAASEKIVSWNVDESAMRNCYQNIRYIVHVGYTDGTESKSFADIMLSADADGSMAETSVTVTGLSSNTLYNYQVECYNILDQSNSEFSDIVYGTTSHSSTPDPVKDLQVAQGESTDAIRLEFKLPSKVDIKEKSEYISTGLYFKIYRRLAGSNYDYDLLDSRFGIEDFATDDMPSYTAYDEHNPDVAVVEWIDCPGDSGDENETKYTDTTLAPERGSKYEYKVVSYADTEKSITSTSSVVSGVTGWLISPVTFNVKKSYKLNEDSSAYDSVDVSFDFSFDSMGKDYKYRISYTKTDLNGSETSDENLLLTASTLDELIENSAYSIVPSDSTNADSTNGYYSYKFYILNCDDESIVYDSKNAAGSVTVIDSYSSMPVITNFSVKDGYLNKFVITFDYQDGVDYHLIYTDCITGEVHETKKLKLTETNGVCKYEHLATSGDKRYYKLKAVSQETGISTDCDFVDGNKNVVVCKTLGTPSLTMAEADYSSITVSWPVVQMADSYEVSAHYSDGRTELIQTSKENSNGFTVLSTENDTVSCIINKPEGFDDSSSSGKTIVFKVSAKNNSTDDTSFSALDVYTLGPALIERDAPRLGLKDTLKFTWTPANGAKKYIVYRISYGDKDCSSIVSADKLLIDATTCSVTELNEGQTTTGRTTCVYENGKYTLTDVCADAEEDSGYVVNQDKIRWGLPYGYVVFPVKENADKKTLLFSGDKTSFASNSLIPFDSLTGNIAPKICCTLGFGLNVHAAKSESASQITVTWEKPNDIYSAAPVVYRRLYSPESGESNSWVKVAYGFNPIATKFEDNFSDSFFKGKDKNDYIHRAFEYAVEYVPNTNPSFNSLYLSEISTDDQNQNYDFGSRDKEPSNKGYLFAIKGLYAECGGSRSEPGDLTYFQENVQWNTEPWDFDERAICPETFELCIMNKNLSSTAVWVSIAQFSINSSGVIELVRSNTTSDDDIDVTAVNYGAFIRPMSLVNGSKTTEGLLLVMRDTKHYYSLNITGNGCTDRQAGDESVYAYRQITDTELAKCVSLIIADALYECGIPTETGAGSAGTAITRAGKTGSFMIYHRGWYNTVKWGFEGSSYQHIFSGGLPCDSDVRLVSDFILTADNAEGIGIKENKLHYLPELSIEVTSESGISSHSATVAFTAGENGSMSLTGIKGNPKEDSWALVIKVNGSSIVSTPSYDEFVKWFPFYLHTSYPSAVNSYDSSLPLYNSPWWR